MTVEIPTITTIYPVVPLEKVVLPIERLESPSIGKTYRLIGVKLWGEGAYERESIDGSQTQYKTLSRVETNDIIVNKIWARNGSVAVVSSGLSGCFGSNEFPTFAPIRESLEPRWFHWLTKTRFFWNQCDEKSRGTSGQNRIRPERFLEILIPLPSLKEQCRIVARIEELAAKVEEARGMRLEALQEAESLARSHLDKIYEAHVEKFGTIALEQVCLSITDGDHTTPRFTEKGVRFIFVGNVSSGNLHFNGCKYVEPEYFASIKAHRKPSRGDILYSAVGATLGIPAIVDSDEEFCFQRHIALLKLDHNQMNSKFLWYILRSNRLYKAAWAGTTGSAQPTVPLKTIRSLEVPVPPLETQQDAVTHLDDLQSKIDTLKQLQSETEVELNALLPSILDKAFKGEL